MARYHRHINSYVKSIYFYGCSYELHIVKMQTMGHTWQWETFNLDDNEGGNDDNDDGGSGGGGEDRSRIKEGA